jgi:adenosylmethionine-8-amino-7-oxononanoate aminotransferase
MFRSGYTYAGHPAACAAAVANIDLIESEGLVDRANHIGKKTVEGYDALVADGIIESYRGVGGIWGVETGRDSTPLKAAMLDAGVFVRGVGNALVWCPPLVITDDEIGRYIETLEQVLRTN